MANGLWSHFNFAHLNTTGNKINGGNLHTRKTATPDHLIEAGGEFSGNKTSVYGFLADMQYVHGMLGMMMPLVYGDSQNLSVTLLWRNYELYRSSQVTQQ